MKNGKFHGIQTIKRKREKNVQSNDRPIKKKRKAERNINTGLIER